MPLRDNVDEFEAWLDAALEEFGWDVPAADGGGTLASAVVDVIVDGQQARARVQRGSDGGWDDNTDAYRDEKEGLYGQSPPNFRTRQMLSRESLRGTIEAGRDVAEWTYGTGEAPGSGRTKRDRTTTDTDKAYYAHIGQSPKKVERPFFAVTEEDADDALPAVEDAIAAHLERKAREA